MGKKWIFGLGFLGWILLITVLSLVHFPEDPVKGLEIPHLDKLVHFTFYFVASILACFYLKEAFGKQLGFNKILLISLLFAWFYGILIEVLQSTITTNRSGDMYDVWANCLGALIGVLLLKLWFSGKRAYRWKH
ncbi:VanZ family protein [Lentiprolixibacter aurantiacus]|uniref:VanZ family protein n=1 Tax=Lentiprolixibacter aurantiacus TaxID=2993939 RepID=A0AAE3SMU0_9FLAO|nr:VanZ family protein [Lentiprolixibacter aurantiacus]